MLIHNKDDIQFVTEFPCFLGQPVERIRKIILTFKKQEKFLRQKIKKKNTQSELTVHSNPFMLSTARTKCAKGQSPTLVPSGPAFMYSSIIICNRNNLKIFKLVSGFSYFFVNFFK